MSTTSNLGETRSSCDVCLAELRAGDEYIHYLALETAICSLNALIFLTDVQSEKKQIRGVTVDLTKKMNDLKEKIQPYFDDLFSSDYHCSHQHQ